MASFRDLRGRDWPLDLNFGLARRVLAAHKVDLVNWHDGKAYIALAQDDQLLVSVLWVLIAETAEGRGVDEVEFAHGLNGDVLAESLDALTEAVVGFTRPDRRELVRRVITKARQVQADATTRAARVAASPEADRAVSRKMEEVEKRVLRDLETTGT